MSTEPKEKIQPKLNGLDAYKIALETRNMEIGLFWQRSNYFLVLNAALAIGFFRLSENKYAILLATLGVLVSFLWYRVNLGSKYWQSRWEQRLKLKELEIAPDLQYFSASWEVIQNDVKESLNYGHQNKGKLQKWLDNETLKKPSVSYNMTLLSFIFLIGWVLLIITRMCSNG